MGETGDKPALERAERELFLKRTFPELWDHHEQQRREDEFYVGSCNNWQDALGRQRNWQYKSFYPRIGEESPLGGGLVPSMGLYTVPLFIKQQDVYDKFEDFVQLYSSY